MQSPFLTYIDYLTFFYYIMHFSLKIFAQFKKK